MLPCKPDKGARIVPMAGREVSLQVIGCDTGDATFAVMFADLGDAGAPARCWPNGRSASLSNMHATRSRETPFRPDGALALPQSLQVVASGQRADGSKVESQAAYFAQGRHVFQAVIYSGQLKPEVAEPFFSRAQVPMSLLARRTAVAVFLAFAFAYFFSALLRAITATLSPTLTREFALNAQELGLAGRRLLPRLRGDPAAAGHLAGPPWAQAR